MLIVVRIRLRNIFIGRVKQIVSNAFNWHSENHFFHQVQWNTGEANVSGFSRKMMNKVVIMALYHSQMYHQVHLVEVFGDPALLDVDVVKKRHEEKKTRNIYMSFRQFLFCYKQFLCLLKYLWLILEWIPFTMSIILAKYWNNKLRCQS